MTGKTSNGQASDVSETVMTCHDIEYTVQVKPAGKMCAKAEPKKILNNINAIFKPGMNAILGATGSGKSSLLDILAGRKDPLGLEGHVLVNGRKQPKNFKALTGYVVQDDVILGTLTVRENLMFSANMRLSKDIPLEEKERRVDETLRELGLSHVAHSKVGNQFIRGISGGERKRTNIGVELIVSPSLLFLDEPTSGLDANTASSVLRLLSRISKQGRTIIFSIHQPRYTIYKLFSHLVLLAKGNIVYQGPTHSALTYFEGLGFECEAHNNPSDFFLDIINADPEVTKSAQLRKSQGSKTNMSEVGESSIEMEVIGDVSSESVEQMAQRLSEKYNTSQEQQSLDEELRPILKAFETGTNGSSNTLDSAITGEFANSFFTQFKYLSKRTILNLSRNPAVTVLQVLVLIILAFISGVLFLRQGDDLDPGLQNRQGLFFFTVMNMVFSNMGAIELFIKERLFFMHERSNGFYRTSAYFLSKIVFDFVPLRVIPVVFYSVVIYFMSGLQEEAGKFFFFLLTLVLVSLTSASIGFAIGAGISIYGIANILIALSFVMQMIFGGLFVNLDSIWVGVRWLQYFSLFKYGFNALLINELRGFEFATGNVTVRAGEELMDSLNIDYDSDWDKWQNVMALGILTCGYLALAYFQMRRIKIYT